MGDEKQKTTQEAWEELMVGIEEWKAEYLSPFCLEECASTCCDFSGHYLSGTEDEIAAVLGYTPDETYYNPKTEKFELKDQACPQYDPNSKHCMIRDNPDRPPCCSEYPVQSDHNSDFSEAYVTIDQRCGLGKSDEPAIQLAVICQNHGVEFLHQ